MPIMGGKAKWEAEGKRRMRRSLAEAQAEEGGGEREGKKQNKKVNRAEAEERGAGKKEARVKWKLPSAVTSLL